MLHRILTCSAALLAACALTPTATLAADVEIKEWLVPYENSRPRDPFVAPDGKVWFCGQGGAYLAYFQPESGKFSKVDLADGASPHNLIIDADGHIWFAANTKPYIGKLDPASGAITKFAMPTDTASDPHTLVFDEAGDIWFTAQRSNYVGKLDTDSGDVKLIKIDAERARPYGIRLDAGGKPWIALFGTNKLASVDPKTLHLTTYDLPNEKSRVRRLEIGPEGTVWYADYAAGRLGRLDPASGKFTEWDMPGGARSLPYGTAIDDDDVIWLAQGGSPNRLVSFDIASETFTTATDIPNSKGAIRHMYFHRGTGEIWFGEDSNYIGRARLVD